LAYLRTAPLLTSDIDPDGETCNGAGLFKSARARVGQGPRRIDDVTYLLLHGFHNITAMLHRTP
jgi:hypothetical protein